jgi:predicted nucleic acid-binding Zn ribbon protein
MARQWDKTDSRGKCPVCGQHATLDPQHITSQGNTNGSPEIREKSSIFAVSVTIK